MRVYRQTCDHTWSWYHNLVLATKARTNSILGLAAKNNYTDDVSIATFIRDDLAVRLTNGQELPARLTIDALAEHYNVSFTPVRAAVAELIDDGFLEKGANLRLKVGTPPPDNGKRTRRPAKLPELPSDPYKVIVRDLVLLSLKGEPIYLREEATAEKYDVSRSAVRNILHRLAGEGVLDHIPRRGWRLRPFRQDDLQAFIEVRDVLELKALELASPNLDADELQRMLDANAAPNSPDDPPLIDESLHEYLITTAGNPYINDFFKRQGRYYWLLFEWEDNDRATAIETARQHREILTALLSKDWPAASRSLSSHIRNHHPVLNPIVGGGEPE
jgi:DNA-binding GntR family transcriptional regulator